MHRTRRIAIVGALAVLTGVAGCWNPAPEKYPSITFFGADNSIITSGPNGQGQPVQGAVTLTWQTRLADKVNLVATPKSTGKPKIIKTFTAGDTTGCTVNPQFKNSDCVKDGTYQVSPTEDTVYNIQALAGAGNCKRDPTLGTLLYPAQCDDLTADPNASLQVIPITVVAPATVSLTVNGQATATVAPGSDVTADYTVTGATDFGFGLLGTSGGKPVFEACGSKADVTAGKAPCYATMDAKGHLLPKGQVTVPKVTASTVLTGKATNGADDHLGDVTTGSKGSTVTITVPGTPAVSSFTATPDHVSPSAAGATVTLDWTVTDGDAVAVTSDSSSTGTVTGLSGCTAVDAKGAGTCDVAVAGTDGQMVKLAVIAKNTTTGQTSPPATATVMIGNPPTVTFSAAPTELTQSGGDVVLTWSAASATSVVIQDGGGNTVVDTTLGTPTTCDSGNACKPTGDTITVSAVSQTTTWTLTAKNDFPGSTTKTATATVYGPPTVTTLTVQDSAPGSSPVDVSTGSPTRVMTTDSASLAWGTTDVKPSTVTLSTAPVPAGGCANVPASGTGAWAADTGFSFTGATGSYGLTTTGNLCYQFKYAGYANQSGAAIVWELDRKVMINVVTLNSQQVQNDSKSGFTAGATVTADWSNTSNATGFALAIAKGAGTTGSCSAAPTYTAVSGYNGTATSFALTSPTAPTTDCYRLTATNPGVAAPDGQAVFYFGITGQ